MHQCPVLGDQRSLDQFIIKIDRQRAILGRHGVDEVGQVFGKQRRGIASQLAGKVERANDRNTLVVYNLIRFRQRAIAATLYRKINDHRTRPHALHHVLGNENRRRTAGDQCCGNYNVLGFHMI